MTPNVMELVVAVVEVAAVVVGVVVEEVVAVVELQMKNPAETGGKNWIAMLRDVVEVTAVAEVTAVVEVEALLIVLY